MKKNLNQHIPTVVFQHIPTSQEAFRFTKDGGVCKGHSYEGIASVKSDSGLFNAIVDSGQVHFFAVGHNHGNDYCCPYQGDNSTESKDRSISICFGRHSGYGGYSTYKENGEKWEKGTRIYLFEIKENDEFSWSSYVRLQNGEIVDRYSPVDITVNTLARLET